MSAIIIAWQDFKRTVRDPVGLLMTLAVPLVLIVAIGLVAGHTPFQRAPEGGFDALSYIAPGIALFFMMLSVRQSARIIAEDSDRGVRDRLRTAPVADISITAGNTASHIVLLFLQLLVLLGISSLLYGLRWGPTGVLVLVCLALAVCASGWVALLVSLGRAAGRINALGLALTLIFGILSRSFAAVVPSAPWMDTLAHVTPNYWGQHAFFSLALGGGLGSVTHDLGALAIMCAALWMAAAL
ncbi:MAG TPA: ABC transporter permease, partial [Spirochaetia bacterium]|nr:ABC transporter permease [Spirochaetia bacterium]